jgi:glycosyltransferase involved in cell wall biosynthesis
MITIRITGQGVLSMAAEARKQGIGAYVSWTPYFGRSQSFIDALDLVPIYIHFLKEHRPFYAPFKYGPMFVATLIALYRSRARVVFVMDPPVFGSLATYLYCLHTGGRYIMDCHSGVFESKKWQWAMPLQRFLGRRAQAVIVTNTTHEAIVKGWGANALIIGNPPQKIPSTTAAEMPGGQAIEEPFVFVINRFHKDEAVEEVLEAARRLPDVRFYISGDTTRAKPEWLADLAPNVSFTGWLTNEEFWYYARHAEALLTLTTQENTILQGGWEAMFLGQPLVTSNTEALRNYFSSGTVYVENTADGIAAGVRDALEHPAQLRADMIALRDAKYAIWNGQRQMLEDLLDLRFDGPEIETLGAQPVTIAELNTI